MSAFPKTPSSEATPEARDRAQSIAANLYLTGPQLAMLWVLLWQDRPHFRTPQDMVIQRSIAKHLPTVGERLVAVERLADLGLVEVPDVAPKLTEWGRFVASVRRPR